ncbi:MAG: hypothetical protein GX041_02385 [Clostridiales bacterium]|nr:hypothetical protein [Clostridiales bacterium]
MKIYEMTGNRIIPCKIRKYCLSLKTAAALSSSFCRFRLMLDNIGLNG